MSDKQIKIKYNKLLERFNKAEEYFDREDIPYEEKLKQLGNYQKILDGLNYYLNKIDRYESEEVSGGFDIE